MISTDLIMILALLSGTPQTAKPSTESKLTQKVVGYEASGPDCWQILLRAGERYGVPLGIEVDGQAAAGSVSVHVSQGTVGDVFTAIVSHLTGYEWTERDGVVNVLPRKHPSSILDLKIDYFRVTDASLDALRKAIVSLPEVSVWLNQNHKAERSMILSMGENRRRVSVEMHDVTLREIMNQVVKAPSLNAGVFARYGEGDKFLNIAIN